MPAGQYTKEPVKSQFGWHVIKVEDHRVSTPQSFDEARQEVSTLVAHDAVVLTMRADFYGQCARYAGLRAALSDHQLLIGPLREEELREAIEAPAQLAGRSWSI